MQPRTKEVLFQLEERELFISRFRFCTLYLGVPIVLIFTLVDLYFPWDLFVAIFKARLLSVPTCFLCLQLYRVRSIRAKYYVVPAYIFALYMGGYLAYLVSHTGGEASPYYAGLNLVGIAAFSFLPWHWLYMSGAAAILYGPYLAVVLFGHEGPFQIGYLLPHLAFCLATIGIGIITNFNSRMLRRRELESRLNLRDEIAGKNLVIDQKTKEGVYLERLACQFSPQIIEGVKTGRLSLDGLTRREITSIFLDVESSTNRSIRLEQGDYTKILSDFFAAAISILLKHDVTVATYLGDGLLAFSNAPGEQENHKIRALAACLDVLKMHQAKQVHYLDKWRTKFNIRIGMNSGSAHVGFFPTFKIGTYTAIGASVNLASRLCTQAPPNSILVTKSFIRDIGDEVRDVSVRHFQTLNNIKGFEGETFELCSVEPRPVLHHGDSGTCPQCSGKLGIQNNLGDYRMVKCGSCGYSDLIGTQTSKEEDVA